MSWALSNLPLSLGKIDIPLAVRRGIPEPYTSLSLELAQRCVRFIPEIDSNINGTVLFDERLHCILHCMLCQNLTCMVYDSILEDCPLFKLQASKHRLNILYNVLRMPNILSWRSG